MIDSPYSFEQVDVLSLPLINRFYQACRYPAKAGRGERVYCLRHNAQIIAAVKLMPKVLDDQPWWFLRAMCVLPKYRGQGVGRHFLAHLDVCFDRPVYCFPFSHLEAFYARAGFVKSPAETAPAPIHDAYQRLQQQGRDILLMQRPLLT